MCVGAGTEGGVADENVSEWQWGMHKMNPQQQSKVRASTSAVSSTDNNKSIEFPFLSPLNSLSAAYKVPLGWQLHWMQLKKFHFGGRRSAAIYIYFFSCIYFGVVYPSLPVDLHGLSGTFALFFFSCLVENVLIKLINRKMSCSTVVVVVAINVIAAGWEEEEEVLLLQVKICMCRFNYLDINCQRNDVPCVCVANSYAHKAGNSVIASRQITSVCCGCRSSCCRLWGKAYVEVIAEHWNL